VQSWIGHNGDQVHRLDVAFGEDALAGASARLPDLGELEWRQSLVKAQSDTLWITSSLAEISQAIEKLAPKGACRSQAMA